METEPTMEQSTCEKQALQAMREAGFEPAGKPIHIGRWYSDDPRAVRSVVYKGTYEGRPAVFKYWRDERLACPGPVMAAYKSQEADVNGFAARIPEPLAQELLDPEKDAYFGDKFLNRGWLIMEEIPSNYAAMESPIELEKLPLFLRALCRYVSMAPERAPKEMGEQINSADESPADYHARRISNWYEKGKQTDVCRAKPLFLEDESVYTAAQSLITATYSEPDKKMIFGHGHIKPNELHVSPDNSECYLTDFNSASYRPEGYEFALAWWADVARTIRAEETAEEAYDRITELSKVWFTEYDKFAAEIRDTEFRENLRASLAERLLGTVFADIIRADDDIPVDGDDADTLMLKEQKRLHKEKELEVMNRMLVDIIADDADWLQQV